MKIVAVLSSRLDTSTAMNTIGHMAIAAGLQLGPSSGFLGNSHRDGSAVRHAPLARYPFITLSSRPGKLRDLIVAARALTHVKVVDYPEEGYTTTRDDHYAEALASKTEVQLNYIGVMLVGPTASVSPLTGKLSFWRPLEVVAAP